MVESASDDILHEAQTVDVAFLVVGDPFGFVSSNLLYWSDVDYVQGYDTYGSRPESSRAQDSGHEYSECFDHVCYRRHGSAAL